MPGRPELPDNRKTTHGEALDYLAGDIPVGYGLSVATGYLNLAGLRKLAEATENGRAVRLLVGAAPAPGDGSPGQVFERVAAELTRQRNHAGFPPSRAAAELAAVQQWLGRSDVAVRHFRERFLHGKAYLFGNPGDVRAALVTSANLTAGGLFRNLELGLVQYQPGGAAPALAWFDELWEQSSDYKAELGKLLAAAPLEITDPRRVFLRALFELYGDDPTAPPKRPNKVCLAPFQWEGYQRALRILGEHHGVIYADGVGSGKTEVGLALIEEYALRRGFSALVIAPAQLKRYWRERINKAGLPAQVVSYHELATDRQLTKQGTQNQGRKLHNDKDAYRLVVADEGHAFRNPDTIWHRALSRLLGGAPKDLALLTATPINNGLWDLHHLVSVFARHDRAFARWRIPSLRGLFLSAGANERDLENLNPDILFPLADLVSVRRDRRFIEKHYPDASFPDGTPVRFPEPKLTTERYALDDASPGLVPDITGALERLTLARYRPSAYRRRDREETKGEAALAGLLRSAILKRFESCQEACRLTVKRILGAHEAFLKAWKDGFVLTGEALREAAKAEAEGTGVWESVLEGLSEEDKRPVSEFRPAYEDDVRRDCDELARLLKRLSALDPADDPKIALLARLIEQSPSEKIIVFSGFADTVGYLHKHLPKEIGGRKRIAVIGAETKTDERTELLGRFCPKTVVAPNYEPEDGEVDLLLANDVLSEGQNLQQAGAVISYDMPWNPQRVVQRFGRVIRLKSDHLRVQLTTMLPKPGELEPILKLEEAVRRKMLSAGVYGMEVEVMEGGTSDIRAFADRLANGDPGLLDETGAVDPGRAFSGEELRAALARWIREEGRKDLEAMRWGTGAVFCQGPGVPSRGEPGVFFACRTRKGDRYWRYVTRDGETRESRTRSEPDAAILRRINPGDAAGLAAPMASLEAAFSAAVRSIVEEHNALADRDDEPKSLGPMQAWALREVLAKPEIALDERGEAAAEALAVGRGTIVRRALGDIRRRHAREEISLRRAADEIVELVHSEGLRPVDAPEAVEPITEAEVAVVCWMEVLPPEAGAPPDPPGR